MALNKKSITEQVYDMLRKRILNQDYQLGEQINPREIARENGISVMPVRDALLRLANQGLVVNRPRVGFFVKSFSLKEIRDLIEVRKMMEIYCIENHCSQIDKKKVIEIRKAFIKKDNADETLDFDLDLKLHKCIVMASQNNYLIKEYTKLMESSLLLFRYLNVKRMEISYQEHIDLANALIKNDVGTAAGIIDKHLNLMTARVDDLIEEK